MSEEIRRRGESGPGPSLDVALDFARSHIGRLASLSVRIANRESSSERSQRHLQAGQFIAEALHLEVLLLGMGEAEEAERLGQQLPFDEQQMAWLRDLFDKQGYDYVPFAALEQPLIAELLSAWAMESLEDSEDIPFLPTRGDAMTYARLVTEVEARRSTSGGDGWGTSTGPERTH